MMRMANARQREAWNHTAQMLALIANVNRDKKSAAVDPQNIHPFDRENPEELSVDQKNRRLKAQIAKHHARATAQGFKTVKIAPFVPIKRERVNRVVSGD